MDEASETGAETTESTRENRVLAAIVFTDAVAFSKLVGKDEKAAHAILSRDFDLMTNLCRINAGRVLNTMGDGMLMCFGSAVDAMQCAMKIQQALHAQSQTLPAVSVLQHRIGVHLGDIIIDGTNVFGDGVNIAARLQAECKPGAICYSRTVADVIKNKVQVRGRFLGMRHLKNIVEPVPVYEVPSLAEYATDLDPLDPPDIVPSDGEASGSKATLLVIGSLAMLALVVVAVTQLRKPSANEADARSSPRATHTVSPAADTPTPKGTAPLDVKAQVTQLRQRYDFDGMAAILDTAPGSAEEAERVHQLSTMKDWLTAELQRTIASKALDLGGGMKAYQGTRGVNIETANGIVETPFETLPPMTLLAMLNAALASPPSGQSPPAGSAAWPLAFSAEYSLQIKGDSPTS